MDQKVLFIVLISLMINVESQVKCNLQQQIIESISNISSNNQLYGVISKHIYANPTRSGTAFSSWQQMQSLFNQSTQQCFCIYNSINKCRHNSRIYKGYDWVQQQNKQIVRYYSTTQFIYYCFNYDYVKFKSYCFLYEAYPVKDSADSWEEYYQLIQEKQQWKSIIINCKVFYLISYSVWTFIVILLVYILWKVKQSKQTQNQIKFDPFSGFKSIQINKKEEDKQKYPIF